MQEHTAKCEWAPNGLLTLEVRGALQGYSFKKSYCVALKPFLCFLAEKEFTFLGTFYLNFFVPVTPLQEMGAQQSSRMEDIVSNKNSCVKINNGKGRG